MQTHLRLATILSLLYQISLLVSSQTILSDSAGANKRPDTPKTNQATNQANQSLERPRPISGRQGRQLGPRGGQAELAVGADRAGESAFRPDRVVGGAGSSDFGEPYVVAQFDDNEDSETRRATLSPPSASLFSSAVNQSAPHWTQISPDSANLTIGEETSTRRTQLGSEFVDLFDELSAIKSNSISALVQLDYFGQPNSSRLEVNATAKPTAAQPLGRPKLPAKLAGKWNGKLATKHSPVGATNKSSQVSSAQPVGASVSLAELARATCAKLASLVGELGARVNRLLRALTWSAGLHRRLPEIQAEGGDAQLRNKRTMSASMTSPKQPQAQLVRQATSKSMGATATNSAGRQRLYKRQLQTLDPSAPTAQLSANSSSVRLASEQSTPSIGYKMDTSGRSRSTCVEMNQSQLGKCRSFESLVSASMNNSFPGTLAAIEDNCRNIAHLLGNCWPRQLRLIRASMRSHESQVGADDFALPHWGQRAVSSVQDEQDDSCGLEPQLASYLLDRINWMWLNLCMDRKFRYDYVDNLRCLSLWTQERSQMVCKAENQRLRVGLSDVESGRAGRQPPLVRSRSLDRKSPDGRQGYVESTPHSQQQYQHEQQLQPQQKDQQQPSQQQQQQQLLQQLHAPQTANSNQYRANRLGANKTLEELDRELESKSLCCMFDHFLRCVHKQAVRDCGRSGGQFVVNFLARVGTDNMKYLCNSDPKMAVQSLRGTQQHPSAPPTSQPSQRRRAGHLSAGPSAGPFIESNYCSDPRIEASVFGLVGSGSAGSAGASRPGGTRNQTRHSAGGGSNLDSYFADDPIVSGASNGRRQHLGGQLAILIPWLLAFIFNTVLVNMMVHKSAL